MAFPQGSVERLSEVDSFLVDDAERKLQPGLQLENFDTVVDHDINARRTKTEGIHNCFGVNCKFLVIFSNHPSLRVPNFDPYPRRESVLKKVRENGRILESVPSVFKSMQDVVMAAVQQNLEPVILPIFWDESHRRQFPLMNSLGFLRTSKPTSDVDRALGPGGFGPGGFGSLEMHQLKPILDG